MDSPFVPRTDENVVTLFAPGWPDVRVSLVDGKLVITTHTPVEHMTAVDVVSVSRDGSVDLVTE